MDPKLYLLISKRGHVLTVGARVPLPDGVHVAEAKYREDLQVAGLLRHPPAAIATAWASVIGALRSQEPHARAVIDGLIRFSPPPSCWSAEPIEVRSGPAGGGN